VIFLNHPGTLIDEILLSVPDEFSKNAVLLGGPSKLKTIVNSADGTVKVTLSKEESLHFESSPALVFRFDKE